MKSINNYINERLNPRHLGSGRYDFSKPFKINESVIWSFDAQDIDTHRVCYDDLWCMSIHDDSLGETLVFCSDSSPWAFCLCESDIEFKGTLYWFAMAPLYTKNYSPIKPQKLYSILKKDFREYLSTNATINEFDRIDVDDIVLDVVEEWCKKYHIKIK